VITLNQWRIEQGIDPTPDGDIYYFQTQGKKTIDEQQAPSTGTHEPAYEPTDPPSTQPSTTS
jgi:hypothetical protein